MKPIYTDDIVHYNNEIKYAELSFSVLVTALDFGVRVHVYKGQGGINKPKGLSYGHTCVYRCGIREKKKTVPRSSSKSVSTSPPVQQFMINVLETVSSPVQYDAQVFTVSTVSVHDRRRPTRALSSSRNVLGILAQPRRTPFSYTLSFSSYFFHCYKPVDINHKFKIHIKVVTRRLLGFLFVCNPAVFPKIIIILCTRSKRAPVKRHPSGGLTFIVTCFPAIRNRKHATFLYVLFNIF